MERRICIHYIHTIKKNTLLYIYIYSLGCNNPRQIIFSAQNRNKWPIVRIKILCQSTKHFKISVKYTRPYFVYTHIQFLIQFNSIVFCNVTNILINFSMAINLFFFTSCGKLL